MKLCGRCLLRASCIMRQVSCSGLLRCVLFIPGMGHSCAHLVHNYQFAMKIVSFRRYYVVYMVLLTLRVDDGSVAAV